MKESVLSFEEKPWFTYFYIAGNY